MTGISNTGQLLTSLAESICREHEPDSIDGASRDPLHLYQEALEFFQRCLSLQEYQFTQSEAEANASARGSMDVEEEEEEAADINNEKAPDGPDGDPTDEDGWAIVMESVTRSTLLDTLLAQVETLTSVCGLFGNRGVDDSAWVEQYYDNLLHERLMTAGKETGRQREVALTKAKLRCALADVGFSTARLDVPTYEREISAAYEDFANVQTDAQALCDRADAELAFNTSTRKSLLQLDNGIIPEPEDIAKSNIIRWKHLTKALDSLTAASKLQDAKNLPRIHLRRGDYEMHRRSLGATPLAYDIASKSEPTLLKNAEIFYRVAARLGKNEGASDEEGEASMKEAIIAGLSEDLPKLREKAASDQEKVQEVIEDMAEEGMLSMDDLQKLGL